MCNMNKNNTDNIIKKDDLKTYEFYIEKHNEYVKKYGQNTVILMLVGSFYELYSIFNDGPNIDEISKLLNIQHTKKDKGIPESKKNPRLCGFQMNSLDKFMEILTDNNYTVVIYDQKKDINIHAAKKSDRKKISRELYGVFTKSININCNQQSNNNYLLCIYISNDEQKNYKPLKSVGLSCVDLSTGNVQVHSAFSEKYDEFISLDDASRFINNTNPGEILIYYDDSNKNVNPDIEDIENYLYGYLNIDPRICRYSDKINQKYKNKIYQNEYLKKIYPSSETLMTPIEQLDLEREDNIVVSLCLLFDYVYDRMPSFLKDIKIPEFSFDNSHLVLGNNAVYQLDIFDNKENESLRSKYKSLFHVVNETLTPMGERYLRNILSSPYVNTNKLNDIYDLTEKLSESDISSILLKDLISVRDIERLARKMELKIIKPVEICILLTSYEAVINIFTNLKNMPEINKITKETKLDKEIRKMIDHVTSIFNMDKLILCNNLNFDEDVDIFNKNVHADIDKMNCKINTGKETVVELRNKLLDFLPNSDKNKNKNKEKEKEKDDEKITMHNTKKEGNHFQLKNSYALILKKLLDETDTINIDDKIIKSSDIDIQINTKNAKIILKEQKSALKIKIKNKLLEMLEKNIDKNIDKNVITKDKSKIDIKKCKDGYHLILGNDNAKKIKDALDKLKELDLGFAKIKSSEFKYTENTNKTQIKIPFINENASKLDEYIDDIGDIYKMHYLNDIQNIHNKFNDLFIKCNEFITRVDYLNSCVLLSQKKGYCRPVIKEKKYSFVSSTKIRHPIVERIIDHEYVPHDISIGNSDLKGILIYGLNSAGKSVLMKSIGLCIIMAQSGLFVPAESFVFSPYHNLMTRITGNDNIFKGLSSFGIEMSEINSILKRSNQNTLIIGDEICRGTEHVSGNALVASTIIKLIKLKPTFIFTTHLHEIMSLKLIQEIQNVKAFHLKVTYDTQTETLIYDRRLTPGCGEPIYGITVAKYIIQDKEFIDIATEIKNELLDNYNSLISGKKSRYNKDVYVYECNICKAKDNVSLTNLETHHINFQKDCDKFDVVKNKKHMKKNDKANLIILCQNCHNKIHDGEFNISGYIKTSNGKQICKK
jgi:DNA mismatch repair protein MutS